VRTDIDGHYDLIDALIYLLRNIDIYTMPYPDGYDMINREEYFVGNYNKEENVFKEIILGA